MYKPPQETLAYIIGVALGDGNLSNPNGRAIRLRITCDAKYPQLANQIIISLREVFPNNKVSIVYSRHTSAYYNISVYSNKLSEYMPWSVGAGSKIYQHARVPIWIRNYRKYVQPCLRGLLQTDGSIYSDRGYLMVNFTSHIEELAYDVLEMLKFIGFRPTLSTAKARNGGTKYCVRVARDTQKLIETIKLFKS